MAISRKKKERIIRDLACDLKKAKGIVFVDYTGLTVSDISKLRKKLFEADAKLTVAKKTLIQIALKKAGIKLDVLKLKGQLGLVLELKEEIEPIKAVFKSYKEKKTPRMLTGVIYGEIIDDENLVRMAALPSKEELRANLISLINMPLSSFVSAISGVSKNLVYVLSQIKEAKENG